MTDVPPSTPESPVVKRRPGRPTNALKGLPTKKGKPSSSAQQGGGDGSSSGTPGRKRGRPRKVKTNDADNINAALSLGLMRSPLIEGEVRTSRRGRKPLNRNSQEPPVSAFDLVPVPQPIYTGLPLEEGPTSKIKKESLWQTKRKLNGRSRESSVMISNSPSVDEDNSARESPSPYLIIEDDYIRKLRTKESDTLTNDSNIRTSPLNITIKYSPKSIRKRTLSSNDLTKTPKPDLQFDSSEDANGRSRRTSKRVKVSSPKKSSLTSLAPRGPLLNTPSDNLDVMLNEDFCSTCGGAGMFICCETCPRSFHFLCTDPPIEVLPENNWICRECMAKSTPPIQYKEYGLFGPLLNALQLRGPKVFQLPKNLRENTFLGVSTGENGDYLDLSMKPILSYAKANGNQIPGFNKNDALDVDALYDKSGKPYLCHKCGESGANYRTLIHCDYCPLVWHLDCLSEPMCIPKTIGTKWRCPNHAASLIPAPDMWSRRLTNATVQDAALHSHFSRIASLNNIFIKFPDQEYIDGEGKPPLLSEYLGYQKEDFAKFDTNYIDTSNRSPWDDIDDGNSNFATSAGISAPIPSKEVKIIKISSGDNDSFIYRIPESLVVLDFVTKVKGSYKRSVLDNVKSYDMRNRLERNHLERTALEGLQQFTNSTRNQTLDLSELVKIALKKDEKEAAIKTEPKSTEYLSYSEIEQLKAIKALMNRKGYAKMMAFLDPHSPAETSKK